MDRLYKPSRIRQEPIIALVWIVAIMAIVAGLYMFSPFLNLGAPTASTFLFEETTRGIGIFLLGTVWSATGVAMIYGIKKNKSQWIARGLLLNFLARVYAFIIGITVYGLEYSWVASITLMFMVFIMYLAVRRKV